MIQQKLSAVSIRLRLAALLRRSTTGLAIGAACALLFAVVKLTALPDMNWLWAPALMVIGTIVGAMFSLVGNYRSEVAARVVDERCDLKDGGVTALQFVSEQAVDAVHQLQVEKTQQQFANVDPVRCVPMEIPKKTAGWAGGMIAAVTAIFLLSTMATDTAEAEVQPLSLAVQQSEELRSEMLKELTEETKDPEIEKLLKELKEKVDALESESIDEADLLATLSEMEQAIAEAQEALNPEMTDATLKALAEAIKPSDALQSAAQALENEEFEKAAEQLKAADLENMSDKQRRAVADNLKKCCPNWLPDRRDNLANQLANWSKGWNRKTRANAKSV